MPGLVDAKGLSYISSHSADVILSDIRPTKLKPDALRAINILLDEFLYKMLSISGSLATDKLRASLLGLLPTNLGKEALLEAEVELRAYWERTESRVPTEDDNRSFHLQWAFELLRLKCEAYSTLNEEDEDPNLEGRVSEKLGKAHPHPPKVGLVDPAALYLTAILEAICEHVLSNVGRVVARDSSRAIATVNDLFVALCEDVSIYGLFKTMKVYQQIEEMSKGTLPRRSKSFTRNDLVPPSRTSSPLGHTRASGSRSRQSLVNGNNKVSSERDGDSQLSHNKSESWRSEQLFADDEIPNIAEDAAMLREFDDLMRSTSTMKVSLTPDRLRTMEVYKQQRDINRRPPNLSLPKSNTPSQKHLVDSIIEDEEENPSPQPRVRKDSEISQRTSSLAAIIPGRIRTVSTSSTGIRGTTKNLMRSPSVHAPPSSMSRKMLGTPEMLKIRDIRKPPDIGIPARTRTRQHRRDSLDIDDVMNGSDDDGSQGSNSTNQKLSPPATAQRISRAQYPVSSHTRDLMAFLAEGPPDPKPKLSQSGSELFEFLAQGPPDGAGSPIDSSKPKSAGRLQRMISKLSIGGERTKASSDTASFKQPGSPVRSTLSTKPSVTTLSSLANRPIPPRPNLSPQYSYDEDKSTCPPTSLRNFRQDIPSPHETILVAAAAAAMPVPVMPAAVPSDTHPLTTHVNGNGNAKNGQSTKEISSEIPLSPVRPISRKAVPVIDPPAIPFFTETDAKDMQRLLTQATTADECRLIFNMFMARSGMTEESVVEADASCPSPSSSLIKNASVPLVHSSVGEALIESTLIEFFLSGTALPDAISRVLSERNQPDVAIEIPPVATEAQAIVTPTDLPSPSNRRSDSIQ